MPYNMLTSAINTSASWCDAHLPVEAAREKIPFLDAGLRLADTYGMPVVVKIDSAIDGALDQGNTMILTVRNKTSDALIAVRGYGDSLKAKEEDLVNKAGDVVTEKKGQFEDAKQVVVAKASNTYQVVSSTIQNLPKSLDIDMHLTFDKDNKLVSAVLALRDRVMAITAKGLDMTIGNDRRNALFERGAAVTAKLFGGDTSSAVPTTPTEPAAVITDKASETSTVEPVSDVAAAHTGKEDSGAEATTKA
ncbi:Histone deacetylase complex subunit sap18 [Perkinsus chesapeaki]|uniref:Histone deacetylase complex subunit sap18 n=1 Tax=Perkinsus chesapeaki TaxID=330153 RepID=A0A7J6MWP2_PERCH|nr:Histone deacetylase complex subunit sap18 [Perkinsus chesapeaki]